MLLQCNSEKFAEEMYKRQLISEAAYHSHDPPFIVIEKFLATLRFVTNQGEIEQLCMKYLKVFHIIGGHYPSEYPKENVVLAVKTEVNIDLQLNDYINIE